MKRLAGTLTVLRAWQGQRRFPYEPRERQLEARDRRVRKIVRHAARHVPAYRALDPAEILGADDLARLPLISRKDLLEDRAAFRSEAVRESDGLVIRTSGSSGEPLDVLHDRRSALANIAYSERERAVVVAMLGTNAYRALAFEYSLGTLLVIRAFYDRAAYRPRRPPFAFVPSEEPLERCLEALERVRPDVVIGTGSWLEPIFREVVAAKRPIPLPRLLVHGGSAMSASCRELIDDELAIPVVSRYAAAESLKIGYTCQAGGGFHLHEDLCIVELIGPDGAPVADGDRGSVVISNLVNLGTVLLRYELGDHARITSAPCACGRTSRRLVELEGKRFVNVRLPDGSTVHSRTLWGPIKRADGVRRFQILQREPTRFEIRLVTDDHSTYDAILPDILSGMRALLPGCEVEASWHNELRAEPGRRFETIVALEERR
jgi:phenylacetate-coenzyme A ligase PaaK-like adenylate-forming protein